MPECPYCRKKFKRRQSRQVTCGRKTCHRKRNAELYYQNIEARRKYRREYEKSAHGKRIRRAESKRRLLARDEQINKLKARPCMDCGHKFPPVCMDFDHVKGNKVIKISTYRAHYKWKTLLKEIAKCELVCANCHRIRTQKRGYKK